jgi:hypothetical protein
MRRAVRGYDRLSRRAAGLAPGVTKFRRAIMDFYRGMR